MAIATRTESFAVSTLSLDARARAEVNVLSFGAGLHAVRNCLFSVPTQCLYAVRNHERCVERSAAPDIEYGSCSIPLRSFSCGPLAILCPAVYQLPTGLSN